ncbi:MAG: RDD family protein [Planctomycetes bacterium]|nr:RDD family protein [Planctomycetota bacterium]
MANEWSTLEPEQVSAGPSTLRVHDLVGWGPRVGAMLVDLAVFWALVIAASLGAGITLGLLEAFGYVADGWDQRLDRLDEVPGTRLLGLLGLVVLRSACLAIGSATPGKLLLRQRVVELRHGTRAHRGEGEVEFRVQVEPIGWRAAVMREVLTPIDGLFFGLVGALFMNRSALVQRAGDQAAHTLVLRRDAVPPSARRATFQAWIGLGFGAGAIVSALVFALVLFAR